MIYIYLGEFSFIDGKDVAILDSGKVLISTMKIVKEFSSFGSTRKLGENQSHLITFNFKAIQLKSPNIDFGIIRQGSTERNKTQLFISLLLEGLSATVNISEDKTEKKFSTRNLTNLPVLPEFKIEVNSVSRTIRFLLSGEQLHDGDIPIPWNHDILDEMAFFVGLFEPGDCVCIID